MRTSALLRRKAGGPSGFTLIEVIITLTVFILLTASVFGIMTAVFQSSNTLKDNQNRRDELTALRAFLGNRWQDFNDTTRFATYQRGEGDGLRVNGVFIVTPSDAEAIDAVRQPNGLYSLRLGSDPDETVPTVATFTQKLERNVSALNWIILVRDIRTIKWRFQSTALVWTDDWTSDQTKPILVECSVQLAGDDKPTTMDFSIPHVVASPSQNTAVEAPHAP